MKKAEELHKKYGNLFQSLELKVDPRTVTSKILKKSYRKLALRYHPDKNFSAEASLIFVKIKEIYQFLLVDKNREEYIKFQDLLQERKKEINEKDKEKLDFARKLLEKEASARQKAKRKVIFKKIL